jgi:hypothetical protein
METTISVCCCKRKTETANFRLIDANGKRKFVFLGGQTIKQLAMIATVIQ